MNTRGIRTGVAMALVLGLLTTAGLYAQHGNGGATGGHGKGKRMEKALSKLDLTDQQKAEIERLREAFKADNEDAIEELRSLREKMRTQQQNGDKEGAKATREQIKAKRETLRESGEALQEKIAAVLTEEQRAQLKEMKGKGGKKEKGKKKSR